MCRGKIENYPEPVRIFLPKQAPKLPAAGNRIIVHFHGNNFGPSGPRDSSPHFKDGAGAFGEWLDRADSKDLLVVPESIGNTKSYDELFKRESPQETSQNFSKFLTGLENVVGRPFDEVALSGHSGGYRAIAALGSARAVVRESRLNEVSAVALFDAVYGRSDRLAAWIPHLKSKNGTFYCVYSPTGGTVAAGPGDQRELNALILNSDGVEPRPFAARRAKTGIQLLTAKVGHMDMMRDDRYTDFLRSWQKVKRQN